MSKRITIEQIEQNTFFWYMYIKWFRGFDAENELNIDEALEVIDIDENEFNKWQEEFYQDISNENASFISGSLNEGMSFHIEFQEFEIVFFLNETYIGNLGGHFEAWFLTWDELLHFEKHQMLFLLLLPITGIEKHQIEDAKSRISQHLKTVPKFERDAPYLANCITNGLIVEDGYSNHKDIGTVNSQNHSVRNVEKYPRYTNEVKQLNIALNKFVN